MVIDADGHLFETEAVFEKYMAAAFRPYRPRLITDDEGHSFWVADGSTRYRRPGQPGARNPGTAAPPGGKVGSSRRASAGSQVLSNVAERLTDLDKENIDVQYLYPSYLLHINSWTDGVLGNEVCRAYNTWLADVCREAPDRLKGVGLVCLADPAGAAGEVPRMRELGLSAVMVNGTVGSRALAHPEHETFFAAADAAALPVAVHFSYEFPGVSDLFTHFFPTRVLAGLFPIMAGFTSVLCTGLMDRHPHLRFAFLEGGCNWVASFVERMDEHYESPAYGASEVISQRPRELLDSGRIFFGCEGNEPGLGRVAEEIGEDKLLYSSDYPHGDRTEGTVALLRRRDDLSEAAKTRILEDNARQFYGE